MIVDKLSDYCSELVDDFAKSVNALDVEKYEDKKFTRWTITLNILQIDFMYMKKSFVGCPVSTLYSRIYLYKNASIFYNIPEIIDAIDDKDFKCYYFSYIESKERMEACFNVLKDFYVNNMSRLKELSMDSETQALLMNRKKLEMKNILDIKDENEKEFFDDEQIVWYNLLIDHEENTTLYKYTRYTAYIEYLGGNYEKSLKLYEKAVESNSLTAYEKRLINHIKELDAEEYEALPEECASVIAVKDYDGNKNDGISYLLNMLLCYVFFSVLFFIIGSVIIGVLDKGTVYSTVPPAFYSLIPAGFPAIFGALKFRRQLAYITRRKNIQEALAFDTLLVGKKTNALANISFILSFAFGFAFLVWLPFLSIRYYDNHLVYNEGEEFLSFKTEKVEYQHIDDIYYVQGRYNPYGDYIDRESYVIVLSDGKKLDLDGYTSVKDTEEYILPIFDKNPDNIKRLKTIEELKK